MAVTLDKMDLRRAFTNGVNSMYIIIRTKNEIGTSFHYIGREDRNAWRDYYEEHFWVTPESNKKLIDIREGATTEITGVAWGGANAIANIW